MAFITKKEFIKELQERIDRTVAEFPEEDRLRITLALYNSIGATFSDGTMPPLTMDDVEFVNDGDGIKTNE